MVSRSRVHILTAGLCQQLEGSLPSFSARLCQVRTPVHVFSSIRDDAWIGANRAHVSSCDFRAIGWLRNVLAWATRSIFGDSILSRVITACQPCRSVQEYTHWVQKRDASRRLFHEEVKLTNDFDGSTCSPWPSGLGKTWVRRADHTCVQHAHSATQVSALIH